MIETPRVAFVGRDPLHGRNASLIRALELRVRSSGVFGPRLGAFFDVTNKLRHIHPERDVWRSRAGFSKGRWTRLTSDIARQLADVEYDAILQTYPVVFAAPSASRYGIYTDNTMAVTQRCFPEWASLTRKERVRALSAERDAFLAARFVAVMGEQARRSAVEDYGCDSRVVHVVGSTMSLARPDEFPSRPESLPDTVLFVATTFKRKGGETLVEAWRLVERAVPSARLKIVGPKGPPPKGLPRTCDWLGLRRHDELPDLYRSSRVFVLPTKFESSFPNVMREAMSYGLPIVASDVAGYAETFPDREWLVPVGDAPALAERLIALLQDRNLAAEIGRRYHEDAKNRFSLDALAEKVAKLLTAAAFS